MSTQVEIEEGDEPVIDLKTLLANSNLVDANVERENEEALRQAAMEDHGLVDPSTVKTGKAAKIDFADQRAEVKSLNETVVTQLTTIADLTATIAERDAQIQRLGEELEKKNAEAPKDNAETQQTATTEDPASPVIPKAPVVKQPWEQ